MKKKKIFLASAITIVGLASLTITGSALAQSSEIKRTDLQRHDLSVPGREVIQTRVDFAPGAAFGRHSHPGEEIVYVIEGELEYQVEGKPPVTLKAGDVLFIPAGTIHAARNVWRSERGRTRHIYRSERKTSPRDGQMRSIFLMFQCYQWIS